MPRTLDAADEQQFVGCSEQHMIKICFSGILPESCFPPDFIRRIEVLYLDDVSEEAPEVDIPDEVQEVLYDEVSEEVPFEVPEVPEVPDGISEKDKRNLLNLYMTLLISEDTYSIFYDDLYKTYEVHGKRYYGLASKKNLLRAKNFREFKSYFYLRENPTDDV